MTCRTNDVAMREWQWPCACQFFGPARYTELSIAVSSAAALGRAKDFRAICRVCVWDDLDWLGGLMKWYTVPAQGH